jgi:Ca2+-binding RTX toxin-like protein
MSTPANRKGRRRLALLATLVGALGAFLALGGNAFAGSVSCSFSSLGSATSAPATVTIIISDNGLDGTTAADNTITITRSGQLILVNGAACTDPSVPASATVTNVDQINILPNGTFGADGNDKLVIDQSAGPFGPGFTQGELGPGSLNEIEFYANLGGMRTSTGNTLEVIGNAGVDGVAVGQDGAGTNWDGTPVTLPPPPAATLQPGFPTIGDFLVNINAGALTDDDADIWVLNNAIGACDETSFNVPEPAALGCLRSATFTLGAGNDVFTAKGGDGTGVAVCGTGVPLSLEVPLTINGGPGDDSIIGSECSDLIIGGGGTDFIDGNGPEFAFVTCEQDEVNAEWFVSSFGGDLVDFSALPGPLTITINPNGTVTITGTTSVIVGVENIVGSAGNDTITGNLGENLLVGAGGNDIISGDGGSASGADDALVGDDNNTATGTSLVGTAGTPGDDTLSGDSGDDCIIAGPGNDTLNENTGVSTGAAGHTDALNTNGADALDSGDGVDTLLYDLRTTRIVVYLGLISTFNDGADLNADGLTNEFDDAFFNTENVKTGSNQDIISANFTNNRSNNVFTDNAGNDCVEGGPGNDLFEQGSAPQGADVVIGNTGTDKVNYPRTGAVQVALDGVANDGDIATNEGDNIGGFSVTCRPLTVVVNPPLSVLSSFTDPTTPGGVTLTENLNFLDAPVPGPAPTVCPIEATRVPQGFTACPGETLGGDQSPLQNVDVENVDAGSGNDILTGNAAGNVLNGLGGNDTIKGGDSVDTLNGGDGDDLIAGNSGNDAIDGGTGVNWVDFASAGAGGVGVQVNLITGVSSGEGNDTLKAIQNVRGSSFADSISGDASNNVLNGFGGNDAINGNAGADTVNGGSGADQTKGGAGNDKMTGAEGNDAMQGGTGNDNIQGGQGRDTALGQRGRDSLFGNAQPDFLNGGPGRDRCKPGSPGLARGDVVVNCERA